MKVRPRRHFTFALSGVGVLLYALYRLWVGIPNLEFGFAYSFLQLSGESSAPELALGAIVCALGVSQLITAVLGVSAFIRCRTGKKLIALGICDAAVVLPHLVLMYLLGGMFASNVLFLLLDAFIIVFGAMWGRYQAGRRAEDPALPRRLFPFVREFGLYFTADAPESGEK